MKRYPLFFMLSILILGISILFADEKPFIIKSHNLKIGFNIQNHKMKVIDKIVLSKHLEDSVEFNATIEPLFHVSKVYSSDGRKLDYSYNNGTLSIKNLTGFTSFYIEYSGILNMDSKRGTFARIADSYYLLKFMDWIFTPKGMKAEKAVMEYHFPKELDIITEGYKINEIIKGDIKISKWEINGCGSWLYFMIGKWYKSNKKTNTVNIKIWQISDRPKIAKQLIDKIEKIIQFYSKLYTPYPYITFTYLEFPNDYPAWNSFGNLVFMRESATLEIINDIDFIAHEIAHNWWPNYIHLKKDEQLGLDDESFCDFSASLAYEHLFGFLNNQAQSKSMVWFNAYPTQKHRKGKLLLHNLRLIYGEQLFFDWLKRFSEIYKGKNATVNDLLIIAPQKEDVNLNEFLLNWQEIKKIPTFTLQYHINKNKYNDFYSVRLSINQDSDPLTQWYIPIQVNCKDKSTQKIVRLSGKTTEFSFEIKYKPIDILIDPYYIIPRNVPNFKKYAEVLILLDRKAIPLIYKNKYIESLPFLLKALELDAENSETHYLLGRVYLKLNKINKAKEHYLIAISKKLGWYMGNRYTTEQLHIYSHWALAEIYIDEGNYPAARNHLKTILKLNDIEGFHRKVLEKLNTFT